MTNKVFVLFAITIVHFQSAIFSMKNVDIASELKVDTNKSTPNSKKNSVNLNEKSYKKNKLVALQSLDSINIKDFFQKDPKLENNNIRKELNVQINNTNKNQLKFQLIKPQEPLNFALLDRDSYNLDIDSTDYIYSSDDSTETRGKKELIQIRRKYGSDSSDSSKDPKLENNNIRKELNVQINNTNKNQLKFQLIKPQEPLNFALLDRDSYNLDIDSTDYIYSSDDSTETRGNKELIQIRRKYGSDSSNVDKKNKLVALKSLDSRKIKDFIQKNPELENI